MYNPEFSIVSHVLLILKLQAFNMVSSNALSQFEQKPCLISWLYINKFVDLTMIKLHPYPPPPPPPPIALQYKQYSTSFGFLLQFIHIDSKTCKINTSTTTVSTALTNLQ